MGTYLAVDATAIDDYCKTTEGKRHISAVWAFPTNDTHSVFIKYEAKSVGIPADEKADEHLVLLEMRGNQISRMREFTVTGESIERLAANRQPIASTVIDTGMQAEDMMGDAQTQARTVLTGRPVSPAVGFRQSSNSDAAGRRARSLDAQDQARGVVSNIPLPHNGSDGDIQLALQTSLQSQNAVRAEWRAKAAAQEMAAKILLGHGL